MLDDSVYSYLQVVETYSQSAAAGRGSYAAVRQFADPILASILLVLLAPVLLLIGLAVRTDSGPAMFRQIRVGRFGKPFQILKFRTMATATPVYSEKKQHNDPSVTRVGRVLRRAGLDELPQLWNVVRGEMALIGPRPEQLIFVTRYSPDQCQRFSVRPGLTGMWQVSHEDAVPMHLGVAADLYYIQHQGPLLDLMILLRTLAILGRGLVGARGGRY